MNNSLIVQTWADYLGNFRKWDLYVTITFRQDTCLEVAMIKFKRFFKHLNSVERAFYEKMISTYAFFEYNDSFKTGVHIHALIQGINPSLSELLKERCLDYFGFSKIEPYSPAENVKFYLSRKINQTCLAHYDYYKINSKFRGH
jgi:hypothetical protein